MAKKRTLVPYYTKRNQRVEQLAISVANQGQFEQAGQLLNRSKKIYDAHKKSRKVPRSASPFLRSSPVVDGVRMRYEKGQLVPRVKEN